MLGGLEEAAVGSSVSGRQPRVSRLILLLTCLTATALFVLNISIIVCFLRRRAMKRNVSASSSKTTALEVYTPTSGTLTQGDEFPLTSLNEAPPPEYQSIDSQTRLEESEHACLINSHTNSNTPEPLPPFSGTSSRSRSSSPLLNGGVSGKSDIFLLETDKLSSEDNTMLIPSGSPEREEYEAFTEARNIIHSSNNPDVCPTTSDSRDPLLEQHESYSLYEDDRVSVASSQHSSESYGCSQRHHSISSVYQVTRQPTQVIYHGQPHLQQQLEEEQQLYQKMSPCYHVPPQSPKYNQPHQLPTMRSSFSPSVQTETSYCEDTCEQMQETGASGAYAVGQPRRSCLKPSQYNALQRSHSVHNYTYSSLQCVHQHHPTVDQCCTSDFCSNPQLNAPVCGKAKEYPLYYSKARPSTPDCTRHNSISGYIGYKSPLHPDKDCSPVPPDLCKMTSSGTKRVGWKEVLHEGSESTLMPSRGSTDTSTSSTTSTVTLGPRHPSSCSMQDSISSNIAIKEDNADRKIHTIDG